MKPKDVLRVAALKIKYGGWIRFADKIGTQFCLRGAIKDVSGQNYNLRITSFNILEKYLGKDIVMWNDYDCQSQQEAVEALIGAARMD